MKKFYNWIKAFAVGMVFLSLLSYCSSTHLEPVAKGWKNVPEK